VKISAREKRFIFIGAAVVGAMLIYYAATMLLPDREALSQSVTLKKRMLLKQRETLSREESYKARLEQYQKRLNQDMARLLPGDNPNVAGAELQKLLKDFADQNGVEITQKSIQPERKLPNGLTKVTVRIDTNCDPEQLVGFLAAVENYEKFLTVDDFTVNSFKLQNKYQIRPNIAVSGYIASSGKPGEKPAS
jgi:hypothetical protein